MKSQRFTAVARATALASTLAATLFTATVAQAAVVTFDDPGVVEIDDTSQVATYTEAGFTLSGPTASFLPLDLRLVGGFDATPFSLMQVGGGAFALQSLDTDFYDLGFGDASSTLTITGLLGGNAVALRTVSLAGGASLVFGAEWARLSEVSFSADAGFSLDNINAVPVPEPGTLALSALALFGLGLRRVAGLHRTGPGRAGPRAGTSA